MKIDFHIHSKYSADSRLSLNTIFRAAKKYGLDAVGISDHASVGSWPEAKKVSKKYGMEFLQAEELYIFEEGEIEKAHVLGIFLTDNVKSATLPEVSDQIKAQGGMLVPCHPFEPRRASYTTREAVKLIKYFDGIEVFNARVRDQKWNDVAFKFAKSHKLAMTGGSDGHLRWEIGNGYTECKGSSLEDLRKALKKKKTTGHGKKTHAIVRLASVTGNI